MRSPEDEVLDGDGLVDAVAPTVDTSPRRLRLTTVDDISLEIARVYRDARARRIASQEATRLTYILHTLARVKESNIERRLDDLEQRLAAQGIGR